MASGPTVTNEGQHKKHSIANPECSCPKCDSLVCFSIRRNKVPCSCQKCQNSKTCLYFPHKTDNVTDLADTVKKSMEGDDVTAKERVKREITYEFDEILKTRNASKNINNAILSVNKDSKISEKYKNNEQPSTQIHNEAVNVPHKEQYSPDAKLSAQIMDLPPEKKDDDLIQASETSTYKISAYDVLKKIRDAYKACSCKVCECLVGKSLVPKNNLCKCEPCDCKDCTSFLSKFQYLQGPMKEPDIGCPCIRCTRSQCKGIVNRFDEPQICDCPPSNCTKCDESYEKPCNCKPCQCLQCKSMSTYFPRTFIVAPVGEQYQRQNCECSPCECIECGAYGTTSSHMREAATNVTRQQQCQCNTCINEACIADSSQACKCERRSRVMAKPVEKDVCDYDIRAMFTRDKLIRSTNNRPLRNNTIAMYAKVPNIYNENHCQKECVCDACECITSNCKEFAVDSIKSSRMFNRPYKVQYVSNLPSNACKCFPCECQICLKKIDSLNKSNTVPNSCNCDVCRCLNCEGELKQNNNKFYSYVNIFKEHSIKDSCKCNPCECVKCNNSITCAGDVCCCAKCSCEHCFKESKESVYPIKKAELLTPSSFMQGNLKNSIHNKYHKVSVKDNYNSDSSIKLYDCREKIYAQKDTAVFRDHSQNYPLINKMEYTLPPGKETPILPKRGHISYYIKDDITKYNVQNLKRSIYRRDWEKHNAHASEAPGYNMYTYTRNCKDNIRTQVASERLCTNSCDSGCGSFDNSSVFAQCPKIEKIGQEYNKHQSFQDSNSFTEETVVGIKHNITRYPQAFSGSQGHHYQSFESDSKFYLENIKKDYSTHHPKKDKAYNTTRKQIYWIKNFDVSVTVHDKIINDSKENNSINEDSRNNSADNTNTLQDSFDNLSNSQYIGDHSLSSCSKQVEDILYNNDAYYEGVQKTLQKARAFSLQLMKILEKYERANNEFQSITEKLKLSHATLLSKNTFDEQKSTNDIICLSSTSTAIGEYGVNILQKYHKEQEIPLRLSFNNDIKNKDIRERCTEEDNSSILNISNDSVLDLEKSKYFGESCNTINLRKTSQRNLNEFTMCCDRKLRGVKKSNKSSSRVLKQVVNISKGAQSTGALSRAMKFVVSTQTTPQLQNYEEAATNAESLTKMYVPTEEEKTPANRSLEILPILKKNFFLTTKSMTRTKGVCNFPTLLGEVKQAVQSISMQTKFSDSKNTPRINVALQNLQVEVQKLLEMPLLQQVHNKPYNYLEQQTMWLPQAKIYEFPNYMNATSCQTNQNIYYHSDVFNKTMDCKSSKSCCDAHKVNFLSLRKVSDHTVLVKWTAPRITKDIIGYELLVDGRAVQKVLSPSRCVAVVTCLPHCETVLLTIRTITSQTPSGHFPSSTIVYHPRVK